jgi:hypothetical protein
MNIQDKNVYEYLINFADDRTILNMLSVNRKFSDDAFFKRVIKRKYPLLVTFKKDGESWRQFFVNMTYYISKLQEDFDIPYIPGSDPEKFYGQNLFLKKIPKERNIEEMKNSIIAIEAAKRGNLDIVKLAVKRGLGIGIKKFLGYTINNFNPVLEHSASHGHLDIVKYAIDNGADDLDNAMYYAAREGQLSIVKFLVDKGADNFKSSIESAAELGQFKVVKFLVEISGGIDLLDALNEAIMGGYIDIVKYLLNQGRANLNDALLTAVGVQRPDIIRLLIQSGANNINEAIQYAKDEEVEDMIQYLE